MFKLCNFTIYERYVFLIINVQINRIRLFDGGQKRAEIEIFSEIMAENTDKVLYNMITAFRKTMTVYDIKMYIIYHNKSCFSRLFASKPILC